MNVQVSTVYLSAIFEISSVQAQVLRKLKAVPHTRGLSYDPQGEFVAAVAASGLLQVWEMMNGKQVLNRKKAGPEVCLDSCPRLTVICKTMQIYCMLVIAEEGQGLIA